MFRPTPENISKHLQALVGERNPYTSLERLHTAGQYISRQFQEIHLNVREEEVRFDETRTCNILGLKEGTEKTDEIFVLAAHYDTVEGTPGADDNASAVAALLEIARCLEPVDLKTSLVFAGFTLEEYGFVGSAHFIQQVRQRNVPIRGMISLEMIGYRDPTPGCQQYPPYVNPALYPQTGDFIAVVGNEPSQALTLSVAEGMRQSEPNLPVEHLVVPGRGDQFPEMRLSDHSSFWDNGYRAVMVTDTAFFRNPNYHSPSDTLDTLDIEFIRDTATAIAGFLQHHLS